MLSLRRALRVDNDRNLIPDPDRGATDANELVATPGDWQEYHRSLFNPFNGPARIPGDLVMPTAVMSTRDRFSFTAAPSTATGEGNFGIRWHPGGGLVNGTTGSYYELLYSGTIASTTTTDSSLNNSSFGFGLGANGSLVYFTTSRLTGARQDQTPYFGFLAGVRLVSAGLRIVYTGKTIDASGMIRLGMSPRPQYNENVFIPTTSFQSLMFPTSHRFEEGAHCVYFPLDTFDTEFKAPQRGSGSLQQDIQSCVWYIHAYGFTAPTTFEIEVVRNYEYIPDPSYRELIPTQLPTSWSESARRGFDMAKQLVSRLMSDKAHSALPELLTAARSALALT